MISVQPLPSSADREGKDHTDAEVVFGTTVVGKEVHGVIWHDVFGVLVYEIYTGKRA